MLSGKVAIITGASSGIGEGTALYFARNCVSKLCITGRNATALERVQAECVKAATEAKHEGGITSVEDVLIVAGDLTDETVCEKVVKSTLERFGAIHVLVNNAGILTMGNCEESSLDAYDNTMEVNVRSMISITKLAIPSLKQHAGKASIVNLSSVAGIRPVPIAMYYAISKAAIVMFSNCLALELASHGVRVNCVNPAVIDTDIFRRAGFTDENYQKYLEENKANHPIGRVGTTEEVAALIGFLAADQAGFMTGTVIPIDGGRSLTSQ